MTETVTLPRDVVEQVLDAFEYGGLWKQQQVMKALSDALDQPQGEQGPVRKMYICDSCQFPYADHPPSQCDCLGDETYTEAYLCTHPHHKHTPLTDEQITEAIGTKPGTPLWLVAVAFTRAAEAAHDIK